MEMSIDDAVRSIAEIDKAYRSFSDNEYQALNVAAETMRKYQKIEEIVRFGNANELGFEYVGEKITEVMEDG